MTLFKKAAKIDFTETNKQNFPSYSYYKGFTWFKNEALSH